MTYYTIVRQLARKLSAKTRIGRPSIHADKLSFRKRKLVSEICEIQCRKLRKELEVLQRAFQINKSWAQIGNLENGPLLLNIHSNHNYENTYNFAKRKGSLRDRINDRKNQLNETLEDALKDNIFHESFSERRKHFREALIQRKAAVNCMVKESREQMLLRRKLLQESLQSRKEKLSNTEQKIREQSRLIIEDLREAKNVIKGRVDEVVEKENIYTIPNLLCITRIVFSPYLGYLIINGNFQYALGFMVVAAISDFLDGWVARNFKSQSSKIGSFLDPMADKVLIGTLFITLTYVNLIPVPLTALIIGRDVALVAAGFVIRYKSLPPPKTFARYFDATHATAQLAPTFISKVNTAIQLVLVGSTLAAPVFDYVDHPALQALWFVTAGSTVLAALSYIKNKDTYKYLGKKL